MATSDLAPPRGLVQTADASAQVYSVRYMAGRVLAVLASLRLTVVLFALSIFLIFVGTLAQKDHDVWQVVNDSYFRVWFARVDFLAFERLVQLFFKGVAWDLAGGFYFPGGKLLGSLLLANLAAAHAMRFKVAAEGRRLNAGLATIAGGLVVTYLAIQSGMNQAVESELSPAFCDFLWQSFRGSLAALTLGGAYLLYLTGSRSKLRLIEWRVLLVADVLLAMLTVWLLAHPEARLDNSGIRILWQLAKGSASGIVLLVGCIMVFRKRAGIVLLHGGIALIMLSELFTAVAADESQMSIPEGGTANYSYDIRTTELAVTDHSPADHDNVTVVPKELLTANVGEGTPLDHAELPFTIQVHRWLENSRLRKFVAGGANPATAGFGRQEVAEPAPPATGVGDGAEKVDLPSANVELFSKKTGKSLGTYLVSQWFLDNQQRMIDQPVEVDGRTYDLALRFKRLYHPYTVMLKDFSFDRYPGTNTAKNYSSLVVFKDPEHHVERELLIRMNNPLRYAGTTFYQQSFDKDTERSTVLQVVTNPSWMTPYVGCMLVAIGMLAHFGTMLVRFLRRRTEPSQSAETTTSWPVLVQWLPAMVLVVFGGYIASKARLPESGPSEMQIYEFGKLPLVYEGRAKPYDTLARNSLQILSGRQEVGVQNDKGEVTTRLPAIRWLLDAISGAANGDDHRVFRVENLDLLDTLGLPHRPLFWRYSFNEIRAKKATVPGDSEITTEIQRQIKLATDTPDKDRSLFQSKVLELARKYNFYMVLVTSFRSPPLSTDEKQIAASWQESQNIIAQLNAAGAPHAVPPDAADAKWTVLMEAELEYLRNRVTKQPLNPATVALSSLLGAYASGDVTTFNQQLAGYQTVMAKYEQTLAGHAKELQANGVAKSMSVSQSRADFEVFFNQFSPFFYAAVLYLFAFVLGIFSWVGWTQPLRRASIWLLWMTFALHTFALVSRIYISGRPPITNLYSTAIFIGWAVVLMALVFESIYKFGLGNIVASVIGFLTLLLAYNLSLDGDTFIVLQAVLDTQFWLATHVVAINLGYAATYAAGAWGALYVLFAHVFPALSDDARNKLLRALYGTLCFAIFFSFVGTVLGGLWADDSWGRFWGWDPKENGALMIVLWNALVLHARWGGLVKGRGLATLAVAGNIVTTWSYFGVNELGVGLHAYGASESSTAMWLLIFAGSQFALIGLGLMPQRWFESFRTAPTAV